MKIVIELPPVTDYVYCLADVANFAGFGGVYMMYGYKGELLYVGKTADFRKRLTEHYNKRSNTSGFIQRVKMIEIYEVESAADADIYETYLINRMQPKHNVRKVWATLERKEALLNRRNHRLSNEELAKPVFEWNAKTKVDAHAEFNKFISNLKTEGNHK